MKHVRVLLLALAAVLFVAPAASAQGGGGGGGGGRGGRGMTALMAGITVTPEVQVQIDSIVAKYTRMRNEQAPMVQGTPADSATMAKRAEITQKQYDEIRTLLANDADKAKFDENRKNLPTGRRGGGPGGR